MNNKKRVMIISIIVAVTVVLCLLIGLLGGKKKETDSPQEKSESQMTIAEQDEMKTNNSEEIVDIDDVKKEFDESTEKKDVVNNSKKETVSVEDTSENKETININNQSSSTGTVVKPSKPVEKKITFPHNISGTSLYIQYIDAYDGVFLEDGSDKDVSGTGAMVVTNKGNRHVEYARFTVKTGSGDLKFDISTLPAGASAVVQESNASKYTDKNVKDVVCEVAFADNLEMSKDQVSVVENEDGSLQVTNLTDSTIPCIRVFYKFYMEDEEIYVGGITYTSKIKNLAAGNSCTVRPTHYVAGSSEVVMVRTYETAE